MRTDCKPGQGLHVISPNVDSTTPANNRDEGYPEPMDSSEQPGTSLADRMSDISEDDEEEIPPGQPMVDPSALKVQVDKCLSRKAYLREQLIRADLTHLEDHQRWGWYRKVYS